MEKNKSKQSLPKDQLHDMFRTMVTIRSFEDTVRRLHLAGKAMGLVHLCTGQEAVPVGFMEVLDPEDYISVYHRAHGHFIAKGSKLDLLFAELTHKRPGYGMGRAGEPHLCDAETNNLGSTGIVGGTVPLATGAALSAQLRNSGQVTASFFGDGVLNQGSLFESMNMAAIWSLPVIYVCEDNQYGEFTESSTVTAGEYIDRGAAFGIPSEKVDGMDVLAVNEAATRAVDRARRGDGPSFLVCETYRFTGHHVSDKQEYKDDAEREAWEKRDPIPNFAHWLMQNEHASREQLDSIEKSVTETVREAAARAAKMPPPRPEDLMEHVYAP